MNSSAGIQSNADSMIVLSSNRKIGQNVVLSCLPKDAGQQEFEIALNPKLMWEYVGKPREANRTKLQQTIIASVKKLESSTPDGVKAEAIKTEVKTVSVDQEWSKEHIQVEIGRLLNNSELIKTKNAHYKLTPF